MLKPDLLLETEKLVRSWAVHERDWLRKYLIAGVEDPRLNLQSILSRHFLLRSLCGDRREALMQHEYRFAVSCQWLLRLPEQGATRDDFAAILYALRRGADNAEGTEIPRFLLPIFAGLPTEAENIRVPNYFEIFLSHADFQEQQSCAAERLLNTFSELWKQALENELPVGQTSPNPGGKLLSVLEPACGSANDFRFLHNYGIARLLDYTGFDLCQANVENARALFPSVRFHRGNVFAIDFADKSFDLCIVHDLFEHLSVAGLEQAAQEICRVTRQRICLGFFQMDEIPEHIIRPLEEYHWNLLSRSRIAELFTSNGFAPHHVHIGSFLQHQIGCSDTHNPNAYTFFLRAA